MKTSKFNSSGKRGSKSGFTLMEIMIALIIIAALAAIGIPSYQYLVKKSQLHALKEYVQNSTAEVMNWRNQYGTVPVTGGVGGGDATHTSMPFSAADVTENLTGSLATTSASDGLRFEMVLQAANPGWKWFNTELAEPLTVFTPQQNPIVWDIAARRFKTSPTDRAIGSGDSKFGLPRMECSRVNAAPDEYNNNYYLTGNTSVRIPNGTKVVELVIENANQTLLNDLLGKLSDGIPPTTLTSTQGHIYGPVKASRLSASETCTIRVYIATAN